MDALSDRIYAAIKLWADETGRRSGRSPLNRMHAIHKSKLFGAAANISMDVGRGEMQRIDSVHVGLAYVARHRTWVGASQRVQRTNERVGVNKADQVSCLCLHCFLRLFYRGGALPALLTNGSFSTKTDVAPR